MKFLLRFVLVSMFLSLIACGGAGSGTTTPDATVPEDSTILSKVSGVAAAGAPVIGFVYLTDANGDSPTINPVTTEDDGSFEVDVTGLEAPFILRVVGSVGDTRYDLLSINYDSEIANLNPLTNIIVQSVLGGVDADTLMSNSSGALNGVTKEQVGLVLDEIITLFSPLAGEEVDPIYAEFTADHSGLDGIFDVININVDANAGTVTVSNKLDDTTLISSDLDDLENAPAVSDSQVTELQTQRSVINDIKSMLTDFTSVINSSTSTATDFDPYVATSFGTFFGKNRTEFIDSLLVLDERILDDKRISSITHLSIISKNNDTYKISYTLLYNDRSKTKKTRWVTQEGDNWKFTGNGKLADIGILRYQTFRLDTPTEAITESGLFLYQIFQHSTMAKAKVFGSGLPTDGLLLIDINNSDGMVIHSDSRNANISSSVFYKLSDDIIDSLEYNEVYTIKFFNANNELIETQTRKLAAPPLKPSEINDNSFPSIVSTSYAVADTHIDGLVTINYKMPTAVIPMWGWCKATFRYQDNTKAAVIKLIYPKLSDRSVSYTLNDYADLLASYQLVGVKDQYGRAYVSMKHFTE
ncbi:MAG: hypothetical protein C0603_13345 [Denitrovibrio sp.]|nr:MAG: hypothetical protein C0603_13345 [Denitrovibrio sp.]